MKTEKIVDCINCAAKDDRVHRAISERDLGEAYSVKSVYSKIVAYADKDDSYEAIVRVGFDYVLLNTDLDVNEDILVDVYHSHNKKTGEEQFEVKTVTFVPELPNP